MAWESDYSILASEFKKLLFGNENILHIWRQVIELPLSLNSSSGRLNQVESKSFTPVDALIDLRPDYRSVTRRDAPGIKAAEPGEAGGG